MQNFFSHSLLFVFLALHLSVNAQERRVNYDEAKAGNLPLPSLLKLNDGTEVKDKEAWQQQRRGEVLELFRSHVFGHAPELSTDLQVEVLEEKQGALDGLAIRQRLLLTHPQLPDWKGIEVLLYLPGAATKPAPLFLGLSFQGNHAVSTELDIPLSERWMRPGKQAGQVVKGRATEKARGAESQRWPLKKIILRGYALATAYYGDIEPDHADGWKDGLRGHAGLKHTEQEWAAISAWAWSLSRMLDACAKDLRIDAKHAAVIGHSRLGKAALWAGAQDERFGIVISNNSGEGGAAPARRDMGETTKIITTSFPHWFCERYKSYAEPNVERLPVDSPMLAALMAPRGLYIASAVEDTWADPKGEFITAREVSVVYDLFGLKGVGVSEQPAVDHPIGQQVRYHTRTGKHDITEYDWEQYLKFADDLWQR